MKRLKIGDIIVIAVILLVTLGVFFFRFFCFNDGDTVEITTKDSVVSYPLNEEKILEINSNGVVLSIIIKNGAVYVDESSCPNQNCVMLGEISKQGESIACLPAEVYIKITEKGGAEYDQIIG